jgi:hypothetical protein
LSCCRDRQYPCIATDEAAQYINGLQQKLKPSFVEAGLMIGEFHQKNDAPGLHNPDFRPLQSPIPMLAIRYMHESDLPFLSRPSDSPERRIKYLQAYLGRISAWTTKKTSNIEAAEYSLAVATSELNRIQGEGSSMDLCKTESVSLCKTFALSLRDLLLSKKEFRKSK